MSISGTNTGAVNTASFTLTSIENIAVSNFQTDDTLDNTLNLSTATGVSKISLTSSAASGDTFFTAVKTLVTAEMGQGAGDLGITYVDTALTGTADTQTLNLSGQTAGTFGPGPTATGVIETIAIASGTSANALTVASPGTTTITASGDQNLTLAEGMTDTLTRVNASAMTGKFAFTTNDATAISITGGSADDTITLGTTFASTDSVDGGAGNDSLSVAVTIAAATTLANVTNVETLVVTGANTVTLAANVTPTTFTLTDAGVNTLTLNTGYTNATTVNLGIADTVTNTANVALTVNATVTNFAGATITGGTVADTLNLTASGEAPAAITLLGRANGVETITIVDAGDTALLAGADVVLTTGAITASLTVNGAALDAGLTSGASTDLTNENLTVDGNAVTTTTVVLSSPAAAGATYRLAAPEMTSSLVVQAMTPSPAARVMTNSMVAPATTHW